MTLAPVISLVLWILCTLIGYSVYKALGRLPLTWIIVAALLLTAAGVPSQIRIDSAGYVDPTWVGTISRTPVEGTVEIYTVSVELFGATLLLYEMVRSTPPSAVYMCLLVNLAWLLIPVWIINCVKIKVEEET